MYYWTTEWTTGTLEWTTGLLKWLLISRDVRKGGRSGLDPASNLNGLLAMDYWNGYLLISRDVRKGLGRASNLHFQLLK